MIRRCMTRFMAGRYGGDQLNLLLVALYLICYVVFLFSRLLAFEVIGTVLLLVSLYRSLSRDLERRHFKCPNCGQQMRVPRGKGRITVRCRSCGVVFEEKS